MASNSNSNLDLSKVENEDLTGLATKIEEYYKSDNTVKSALSYSWERNHLFLDGNQWITYEGERGQGGQWRQLTVSRSNEYIPRPVTNYIFDVYQTLKSYLIQNKPRSTVAPNTQRWQDKEAAKIANLCNEANWERLKEEKNYEYAAGCGVLYGTVFKKDFWDTGVLMMAKVPRVEMQPTTDPATGQVVGQKEVEVRDPQTGEVLFDEIPLGDVNTAVVEPYRLALDPLATDLHTARWVIEYSIQTLDWVLEQFDKQEPGYTGLASEVKPEKALAGHMQRFYRLKTSSGVKQGGFKSAGSGTFSDEMIENAVVLKEYYERPSAKYPNGRLVVVANGVTLYADVSPYSGPELGDWHPYSEFRWELVPGRFWGKAPVDDVVEIQKHINSIDAAIILVRKTMAVPQKLIPVDSGIAPGTWTGRPGQEVRYRATASALPQTIQASGVDSQVFKEREQRVEDMKQISGAIDILKGDRPPGVTAASALEMLFEVGTGKLRPGLDRWKSFVESSQKKQLRLIAQKYREPRPQFIKLLHSKNKEISEESINSFIGSDLYDNCNVVIEAGSNIPKLQSAEKAQLLQLAQLGVLGLEQPQNRMEFNKRMGVVGFDNEVSPDVKRAEWENDLMDNIQFSPANRPVLLIDENHELHKEIHNRRMKEPSFLSAAPEVQQAFMAHVQEHDQVIQQNKTMMMQEAAMTGQPPAPPANSAEPSAPRPAGKGISQDTSDVINASDLPKRA